MPVALSSTEPGFGFLEILFTSLKKFAARDLFERFYIIVPPHDYDSVQTYLQQHDDLPIELVNEVELVPTLEKYVGVETVGGWRIQQILKLAVAEIIQTPFYLTFDQDIFCTHPITEENLLPKGKALIQYESKTAHKHWWQSAAHHLNMKTKLEEDGIQVTPAILSTDATRGLIKELSTELDWVDKLLKPHLPNAYSRFHPRFRNRHRWTEYTLYFLYLEKYKLIDTYHVAAQPNSDIEYTLLSDKAVWKKEGLSHWEPEAYFSDEDKSLFALVQSTTGICPNVVLERIEKYIN